jgi:hypothetical protein
MALLNGSKTRELGSNLVRYRQLGKSGLTVPVVNRGQIGRCFSRLRLKPIEGRVRLSFDPLISLDKMW